MSRISVFAKEFSSLAVFHNSVLVLVVLLFCSISACSNSGQLSERENESPIKPNNSVEEGRLAELYWARVDSAKMKFTQADADFMVGMIAHHAQALIMSDLAPKNNASSTIQTLASRIINAQKDEIQSMQQWLRDRNQPVPHVQIDGLILSITMDENESGSTPHGTMHASHSKHSGMDHSGMPGMLTQEQLNNLAEQKGKAFDKAFLKYMIAHHEGAVIMVENLFAIDGAAQDNQSFRLASDIQADQITEIERMKQMLQEINL